MLKNRAFSKLRQSDILSIYTIQDIIPIPSNVKYVLAKLKWEDIFIQHDRQDISMPGHMTDKNYLEKDGKISIMLFFLYTS